MATKTSGASPDQRRKHDGAFKAGALRLAGGRRSTQAAARRPGLGPTLLYRWQQAQPVAEVGSEEVARDPEVRALRARLERAEQELAMFTNAVGRACLLHRPGQPTRRACVSTSPSAPPPCPCASAAGCCAGPRPRTTPGSAAGRYRRGNGDDNAHADSFWSRCKAELLDGGRFPGLAEARLEISHHIACCHAERHYSALGHCSPTTSKPTLKQRPTLSGLA